ncbi:SprT-like domain-containing protein [Myxococcota bacterium]|nr:SprT-like domain-containing protein [Myxococcota bacterium]
MKLTPEVEAEIRQARTRAWSMRLHDEYMRVVRRYDVPLRTPALIRVDDLGGRWGLWDAKARTISINRLLIENYPWAVVVEVLKHEMAHQVATDLLGGGDLHGARFKAACEMLRVPAWAAAASGELPREIPDAGGWNDAQDSEEYRLLRRAEKLLALAESANEHEAALAMQRVRELYARHNLEHVRRRMPRAFINKIVSTGRRRMDFLDARIAGLLEKHFFVRVVLTTDYDAKALTEVRAIDLIGARENVELAEYVFHFLRHKAESLWQAHRRATRAPARNRADFLGGLMAGLTEKLAAPVLTTEETALIRAGDPALLEHRDFLYPSLRTTSSRAGGYDPDAWHSGRAQGRTLTIHRGVGHDAGNRGRLLGRD